MTSLLLITISDNILFQSRTGCKTEEINITYKLKTIPDSSPRAVQADEYPGMEVSSSPTVNGWNDPA